jgi:indolepyruvate ferredoxin oxidoreductase beta subunit
VVTKYDLVIAGVGGQGVVLASRIIAKAAITMGYEARTAENIGMAQREGAVVSYTRIGRGVAGPLVPESSADLLLGFEPAEAARSLDKLGPTGSAIINKELIVPVTVTTGQSVYDQQAIFDFLKEEVEELYFLEATKIATEAGNWRATNSVLLGAASSLDNFPISPEVLLEETLRNVPAKTRDINEKAFELGAKTISWLKTQSA